MSTHEGATDETHPITLTATLEQVYWTRPAAAPGSRVGLEVFTHFVGHGAEMDIALTDEEGHVHGTFTDRIYGNRFEAEIWVPPDAEQALYATVALPAHGLEQRSPALHLLPVITVTNATWSQEEARRGDVLTLTADVEGAPDGIEATLTIYEHDADGAHDLVTQFPVLVENNAVEAEWEFEYHEDTDDIPTDEEAEQGYQAPEYFFRVNVGGVQADSGLLQFKDWIQVELVNAFGAPVAEADYELTLADGTTRTGTLDDNGIAREEDVPPGPVRLVFPRYHRSETIDLS